MGRRGAETRGGERTKVAKGSEGKQRGDSGEERREEGRRYRSGGDNRGEERRGGRGGRETLHTAVLLVTPVPTVVVVVADVSLRHALFVATGKLSGTAVLRYKVTEDRKTGGQREPSFPQKCTTLWGTL